MKGSRIIRNRYVIAVAVSTLISLVICSYLNTYLPASVVESGSMQHSEVWTPGVINTGDIIFEKKVSNPVQDIVTYVVGKDTNFSTYGDYGNVILYNAPGNISIVHRAMFYLEWNGSDPVVAGYVNQSWISIVNDTVVIYDVGYSHRNLVVPTNGFVGESGFITMGDNNLAESTENITTYDGFIASDQSIFGFHPINTSQIYGKAYGLIPWAGLVKLNIMRAQGNWEYYGEVPKYSYLYLAISMITTLTALASSLYLLSRRVESRLRV